MSDSHLNLQEELSIGKNYKLYLPKKLGSGAFGNIYQGINTISKKIIAIKCEKTGQLKYSYLKYSYL